MRPIGCRYNASEEVPWNISLGPAPPPPPPPPLPARATLTFGLVDDDPWPDALLNGVVFFNTGLGSFDRPSRGSQTVRRACPPFSPEMHNSFLSTS